METTDSNDKYAELETACTIVYKYAIKYLPMTLILAFSAMAVAMAGNRATGFACYRQTSQFLHYPGVRLVYATSALSFAHKYTQTNHCKRRWRQEFYRNTEWKFCWLSCVFFHWQTTGAHAVIGRARACSFKRIKVYLCACPFQRRFIVCQWQTHLLVVLSMYSIVEYANNALPQIHNSV